MATNKACLKGDPFQASRALYNELEAILANEEVLLQLTHDALEDLILEKGNRLRNQLREDFLNLQAMWDNEGEDQQATDVCVREAKGEEPVSGSKGALPSTDSAPEAGMDNDVLMVDYEGTGMSGDAVRHDTDWATHDVTVLSIEWSEGWGRLAGLHAGDDGIPIPPFPQNLQSLANAADWYRTEPVGYERLTVINSVVAAMPQPDNGKARSPAYPVKLPCYPRAAFMTAYQISNIIPRAA